MRAAWLVAALLAASCARAEGLRIISLAPNLTEIVFAAGAGDRLVGTVEYSDYPQAARALPRVGDGWSVDVERVLALQPDLVLAWASGTPEATIARLEALRIHVVRIETYRLADVPAALRRVGDLAGTREVAHAAARQFEAAVRRMRGLYAEAGEVSVFIEIDDEPLYTVNGRHVISEVVELCGGRNVFADLPQIAPRIDLEAVLTRDPQAILSTDDTVGDPREPWRQWPQITAMRVGAVYSLPSDTVTRATPRLVEGIAAVCAALDDARRRLAPAVDR